MPTLYVENVPDDVYQALRARAKRHRKSMAAEVLTLLEEQVPTAKELARRGELLKLAKRLSSVPAAGAGPFPSTEQMQREDRKR